LKYSKKFFIFHLYAENENRNAVAELNIVIKYHTCCSPPSS